MAWCWGGLLPFDIPTSLSTFVQVGVVRAVYVSICVLSVSMYVCVRVCVCLWVSVAVGLVGVLGRLLGGRGVSHAVLGQ